MQTLIYQCWTGPMRSGVVASRENISAYAQRIGAEYRYDLNPNIAGKVCDVPMYFEWLNPLLDDAFLKYDRVLALDLDVFAVDGLEENPFDVPIADVGICTEPYQPEYRCRFPAKSPSTICRTNDERWAEVVDRRLDVKLPRICGLLKVYNAGVVMFSAEGLLKARKLFMPFQDYITAMRKEGMGRFYTVDQNYFHAMMVKYLDYSELDPGWNSYVHFVGDNTISPRPVHDSRNEQTKLVHIQLRAADDFDAAKLWRITNRPQNEWRL